MHEPIEICEPVSGVVRSRVVCMDESAVRSAVEAARGAFLLWPQSSLSARAGVLKRVADAMAGEQEPLARLVSEETGKSPAEALLGDIGPALGILEYTAHHGPRMLGDRLLPPDKSWLLGRTHWQTFSPFGVTGVITPWNYPVGIAASSLAPVLMAGNPVVWKPSEFTPGVSEWLLSSFHQAMAAEGLSPQALQMVTGDSRTGKALVEASLDRMVFTGSSRVGRSVQASAQARNIPVNLELGGSDPVILLPGSDPGAVADYVIWGRFVNSGQACAAAKRVLVPSGMAPLLADILLERINRLSVRGENREPYHLGPLISERHLSVVTRQVDESKAMGAQILCGGAPLHRPGYFYPPTLMSGVTPEMPVAREEVFGPVLPLMSYDTVDEAIELANRPGFGLGGSVFGTRAEARRVAKELHAGTVLINDAGPVNYGYPALPWQGWGLSGPGLSHGQASIRGAARSRVMSVNHAFSCQRWLRQPWHWDIPPVSLVAVQPLVNSFMREGWLRKLDLRLLLAMLRSKGDWK